MTEGAYIDHHRGMIADFDRFFHLSSEPLAILTTRDWQWWRANEALTHVLGWNEADLLGRPYLDLVHPDDLQSSEKALSGSSAKGRLAGFTNRLMRVDGNYVAIAWKGESSRKDGFVYLVGSIAVSSSGDEEPGAGAATSLRDIAAQTWGAAEHAQVEARLREAEERYLALFNTIEQGFCTIEVLFDENDKPNDYRFMEVSPSFEGQTGIANALGRRMRDIAPDQDEHWFEIYGRVARTGEPIRFENYSTPLGRWWSVYAFKIGAPDQPHVGVMFYDITEAKRAEEAIRASETRYRLFLELSAEGIWRFELDEPIPVDMPLEDQVTAMFQHGWLAECNRSMARMYGFEDPLELTGKRLSELMEDNPGNRAFLTAFAESGYNLHRVESQEIDRHGRELIFENSLTGFIETDAEDRPCVVRAWGTQRDVTAHRAAESALRQSEERYRSLFESIDQGFGIIELIFDESGNAQDYRFIQTNPAFERQTGLHQCEGRTVREMLLDLEGFWLEAYGRVAKTGHPERFTGEVRGLGKWFSVYAFRTESPEKNRVAILVNDVTEQRKIEEELRAASTLKDEFLSLVSHELRTPLTVIRGTASLLQRYEELPRATHREIVADLVKESDRLRRVVENMLALGRLQAGEKPPAEPLILDRSIRQAVRRYLDIERMNRIRLGRLPEGVVVLGIQGYIEQIIQNFCSNAYKYSPADTTVLVFAAVKAGYARISVADRGRGLTNPEALFTPFYREPESPPTTQGLGLGLAVSKRLAEAMDGTIHARPRRGGGSVFTFTLPVYTGLAVDTI